MRRLSSTALKLYKGFTLLEITIVLVIVGVLSVAGINLYSAYYQLEKANRVQVELIEMREALLSFLRVNKYLPCPDSNGDGRENIAKNYGIVRCREDSGYLPSLDIGMPKNDPWGNRYLYKVNARADDAKRVVDICQTASLFGRSGPRDFKTDELVQCQDTGLYYCNYKVMAPPTNVCEHFLFAGDAGFRDPRLADTPPYFGIMTPPMAGQTDGFKNLTIYDSADFSTVLDDLAVAVVVSFGANGAKTWQACNNTNSAAEKENCTVIGDQRKFVVTTRSQSFDDHLAWIRLDDAKKALLEVGAFTYE